MSIRLKLILFISFLFFTAIANSLFIFQSEKYGEEKLIWVNHTHEVILETQELLGSLKDTETGQRGYLLTSDLTYLTPYTSGLIGAKEHFGRLEELTSDNPDQQKRLIKIKNLMSLKFAELAETIKFTQLERGISNKALNIVKQDKGQRYMNGIRDELKEFIHEENILLEYRKGDFRAHRARMTTLIVVEIMFFIFLAIMTLSFLNKNLFHPLNLLLSSTHKMERGEKLDFTDITTDDEMGYLLSSFLKMNKKVHTRTQKLDYKAHHDELTGLRNRASLHDQIEEQIEDLKYNSTKFAVLFLDLDKFKQLNDTLGHDAGDLMLKEVAIRLTNTIRSNDIAFRLGGDEFLVLLKDIMSHSEVEKMVLKILESTKPPVMIQGKPIDILLSIGIAISPEDTQESDEVLKYSDIAMYEAKHDKNSAYRFFEPTMLKRSSDHEQD